MAKRCVLAMGVVCLLILLSVSAWAVPTSMNYQGKLTDKNGKPLNGTYNMTFYLFTLASGGSAIWTENHPSVQVTDGIYNVELGGLTQDLFESSELYLEVEVGGETLEPRQHLTSTAFSMRSAKAEDAETLDGKDSSEFSASVHTHSFGDITGSATDAQIPNDITINNAATADYANTTDSADYADSAGNADTVDGEHASAFADAVHTHGFTQIAGTATDGQIPNDITINYAASAGNADTLDGLDSSSFLSTSTDYGRSGVSSTLYEGSTALSNKYVGKSGSQTITSGTLTVNTAFGLGAADEIGVKGYAQSETNGSGVLGQATGSQGYGVHGSASGYSGRGVYGVASAAGGSGVYGSASASVGRGVYGENSSSGNYGYLGSSAFGVYGYGSSGYGVYGSSSSSYGVFGSSSSYGVYGHNNNGNYGFLGSSSYGVYGHNDSTNYGYLGGGSYGVYGNSSGGSTAVRGSNSTYGNNGYLGGSSYGVAGTNSSGYTGYLGGNSYGVSGSNSSGNNGYLGGSSYGVYGNSSSGYAGYFAGDVYVSGSVSKAGGNFKIDHPLDPENKYLNHSFVESPDMKNIYDGVAVLDANGERWVELPEWFEALNKDFRYQLTPIGAPGPNLYIAQRITDNRFKIAGGSAGMEVSWQVTGIRQDPWAEANRIPVEEDKAAEEVGFYLSPEAYGQPEEKGIEWGRNPEMMQQMKEEREKPVEPEKLLEPQKPAAG